MVEAVGIEPTSEELRSLVSPCAAGDLNLTPWSVVRRPTVGPARKSRSPRSGAVVTQPIKTTSNLRSMG